MDFVENAIEENVIFVGLINHPAEANKLNIFSHFVRAPRFSVLLDVIDEF